MCPFCIATAVVAGVTSAGAASALIVHKLRHTQAGTEPAADPETRKTSP